MSYWKKCLSTGDYQYITTGEPAPEDIVVQWWEAELARMDKRIAELETAKDNYKQMVVEQKQYIAELKEQLPKVVKPRPGGDGSYDCDCDEDGDGGLYRTDTYCYKCGAKLDWKGIMNDIIEATFEHVEEP